MAKRDDDKALPPLEEWLAPWEKDKDGKKLDEPEDIDPGKIKKFLHGLLGDKFKLQEQVASAEAARTSLETTLTDLQRKNESDEQRREREDKERNDRLAKAEAREKERAKVDAIADAFEEDGITPAQARKLASRVKGDDEEAWLKDAKELVEDGFKVGAPKKQEIVDEEPQSDDLSVRPKRVVRGDGSLSTERGTSKAKSAREELEAAGLMDYGY